MTVIEVVISLGLLTIALLGVAGAHTIASASLRQGKRMSQATAMAQELAGLLAALPYSSSGSQPTGTFANVTTANDADLTDAAGAIDASTATNPVSANIVDHAEGELPASVLVALSPIGVSIPNSNITVFQRYWSIAPIADPLTPANVGGVTIAAIVRWPVGSGYNHVAVVATRYDPQQLRE